MKLKIPVLWHTDETLQKEELGIDVSSDEVTTRIITFYTIDIITDYFEDGNSYSRVYSNGQVFISTLSRDEVENMIDKQLNKQDE